MLDAGAEGFGSCFFGGEACCEALGSTGSGAAIVNFPASKDAIEKAVAVAFDGARDAWNFDEVDACADQHDATVAQG